MTKAEAALLEVVRRTRINYWLRKGDGPTAATLRVGELRALAERGGASGYWNRLLEFHRAGNAGEVLDYIRVLGPG